MHNIVIDDAPTNSSQDLAKEVETRGHTLIRLPRYSPFLNPIEEFSAKVKGVIKRDPLKENDELTPRIVEACRQVKLKDCQGWTRHSVSFLPRCLVEEEKL